jgi:3-oxoacyl-[acyl-carrier-protein] synthase-3
LRKEPTFSGAALAAWARDEGPDLLSTSQLEEALGPVIERLRLPKGLISEMTGIERRALYPADSPPSRGAVRAAEKLFEEFNREKIDLLYATSVGRDYLEPSTASIIQAQLGLGPGVKSLDLGSACLGFVDGLELAALQIEAGIIDYALVVAGENSRPLLESTLSALFEPASDVREFFRHFASLTLGSGGAAMVVGPARLHPGAPKIASSVSLSDPSNNHLCRGDFTSMVTDSAALLEAGVALAARTFQKGRGCFGWNESYFDLVVCHQVSEVNTRRFSQALNLDWDLIVKTYPDYGNMGPVAVPFAFDLAAEKGLVKPGQRVGLMGIGSGLGCAMMAVET